MAYRFLLVLHPGSLSIRSFCFYYYYYYYHLLPTTLLLLLLLFLSIFALPLGSQQPLSARL
jgi:hypothetical protein